MPLSSTYALSGEAAEDVSHVVLDVLAVEAAADEAGIVRTVGKLSAPDAACGLAESGGVAGVEGIAGVEGSAGIDGAAGRDE